MTDVRLPGARIVAFAVSVVVATSALAQIAEWPVYGGDAFGSRWSPLADINRDNVKRLRVAWTYHTRERQPGNRRVSLQTTPIVVDGGMFLSTPRGRVIALDPETGEEWWTFDARVDSTIEFGDHTSRGVAYWRDSAAVAGSPCARRVYFASIDARLFALDAITGAPCGDFNGGEGIDLEKGLRNPPGYPAEYEETSPPTVVNGIVIVGSAIADNNRIEMASGEVRGFDARTGKLRWTWHPIPQVKTDPGHATWNGPDAHRAGGANTWSIMSADPPRDLVFLPTGSASPDYFGGARKGRNLYANSIVALRASTGKLVWHFQTVHHDLWDYDVASPPALVTVTKDGQEIPAVIQASKTGMLFILHRETGEPVFPIEERPVPKSDVPGEESWPTQPFTTFMEPLISYSVSVDDAWGWMGVGLKECKDRMATLRNDGIFTPPSLGGSLIVPGNIGGAHWGGVAYDPLQEIVVVPVNRLVAVVQLFPRAQYSDSLAQRMGGEWSGMHGSPYILYRDFLATQRHLPCTKPPWGELVGVSTKTGSVVWRQPLGTTADLFWSLAKIPFSSIKGMPNLGGPIATAGGLTFIGAAADYKIRAFDTQSGKELWTGKLPAAGMATPVTYKLSPSSRQYVVIAAGGDGVLFGSGDAIIAFAIPQ